MTAYSITGTHCDSFTPSEGAAGLGHGLLVLTGVSPNVVGDEGGWEIKISGKFIRNNSLDEDVPVGIWAANYYVEIYKSSGTFTPQFCYSGVVGQGNYCRSPDAENLSCWTPPLPVDSTNLSTIYSIKVSLVDPSKSTSQWQSATLVDKLTCVKRSYPSSIYALRSNFPPPRDVGPYDIREED